MALALPEGYRIQVHERAGSTNALALAEGRRGDAGRLWIVAREQTAGRGRRGRTWASPPGNLYASLLLVDAAAPGVGATVSFVAAVALDLAIADVAGPAVRRRVALKWPNDVLCDGRKVAGILVEAEEAGGRSLTVVGIGVNCRSHPELPGATPAGDFASLGLDIGPDALLGSLAGRMDEALGLWDRGRNFAAVRAQWLARAAGIGGPVRVALAGKDAEGAFETVDAAGRLVVRHADGTQTAVSAGDATLRLASMGG